jgi:hypothetical protein
MRVSILLTAALFTLTSSVPTTSTASGALAFTNCGWADKFNVSTLMVRPYPPSASQPVTVLVGGGLDTMVSAGSVLKITAHLGTTVLTTQQLDLCTEMAKGGVTCPAAIGTQNLAIPLQAPPGVTIPANVDIDVRIEAYKENGNKLFCFNTVVRFVA